MNSKAPDNLDLLPSKSQRKRDAKILFDLGKDLVTMSTGKLANLPIEEDLRDAINLARNIKSNVARKRQVQFIAKMMRNRDVSGIQEALNSQSQEARQLTVRQHRVEAWRDHLLINEDEAIKELIENLEIFDIQSVRNLLRNARKEADKGKPPASARKIFKLLRELDSEHDLPPLSEKQSSIATE